MGKHRKDDFHRHGPSHGGARDEARPEYRAGLREQQEQSGHAPGSSYGGAQGSYAQGNYGQRGSVASGRGPHDDAAPWQGGAQDHWRQGSQEPGGPGQGGYGEASYGQGGHRRGPGEGAYERGPEGFGQWQGGSRGGYGQPGLEPGSYGAGSYSQGEQYAGTRGQSSQGVDQAQWRQTQFGQGGNPAMSGAHGSQHEGASRDTRPHHDPHYLKWREEQIRKLDADYEAFSQERYSRFADEFDTWRRERASAGGTPQGSPRAQDAQSAGEPAPGDAAGAGKDDRGMQDQAEPPKRR